MQWKQVGKRWELSIQIDWRLSIGWPRCQANAAEAEPLLCEAVAGSKSVLGADHPGTLACVQNLASLLNCQEKLAETETLLRKELET